jgi:hypothetical protein
VIYATASCRSGNDAGRRRRENHASLGKSDHRARWKAALESTSSGTALAARQRRAAAWRVRPHLCAHLLGRGEQGAVHVDVVAHGRRRSRCLDLQLEPPALPLALGGSSRMVRRTAGRRGGGPDGGVHRGTTVVRAPRRRLRATGLGGRAAVVMRLGTERIPRDAGAGVPRRPRRACAPSRPPGGRR